MRFQKITEHNFYFLIICINCYALMHTDLNVQCFTFFETVVLHEGPTKELQAQYITLQIRP